MSSSRGGFSFAAVENAGRDFVLLAQREQAAAVDEVQRLPASELVAVVWGSRTRPSVLTCTSMRPARTR